MQDLVASEVFEQGREQASAQRGIQDFFGQVLEQQWQTACKVDKIMQSAAGANR